MPDRRPPQPPSSPSTNAWRPPISAPLTGHGARTFTGARAPERRPARATTATEGPTECVATADLPGEPPHDLRVRRAGRAVLQRGPSPSPRPRPPTMCLAHAWRSSPEPTSCSEYVDAFGNTVSIFVVAGGFDRLSVTATSEVIVHRRPTPYPEPTVGVGPVAPRHRPAGRGPPRPGSTGPPSRLVPASPDLAEYAAAVVRVRPAPGRRRGRPGGPDPPRLRLRARLHLGDHPRSRRPRYRRGVCQDFAHLAVGCVRSMGLAARYVSGYIETIAPEGQPPASRRRRLPRVVLGLRPGLGMDRRRSHQRPARLRLLRHDRLGPRLLGRLAPAGFRRGRRIVTHPGRGRGRDLGPGRRPVLIGVAPGGPAGGRPPIGPGPRHSPPPWPPSSRRLVDVAGEAHGVRRPRRGRTSRTAGVGQVDDDEAGRRAPTAVTRSSGRATKSTDRPAAAAGDLDPGPVHEIGHEGHHRARCPARGMVRRTSRPVSHGRRRCRRRTGPSGLVSPGRATPHPREDGRPARRLQSGAGSGGPG